jgi:ubiquinone/menaquinone biosynthesis C-methylase UbiE
MEIHGSSEVEKGDMIDPQVVQMLRCPLSGKSLSEEGEWLISEGSMHKYRITHSGIPLFATEFCSKEARSQQEHYDRIAGDYIANLGYPHTQEYTNYLDAALLDHIKDATLDTIAEICCGKGEAFQLLGSRIGRGIGVDVSVSMLEVARKELPQKNFFFLQGDATLLPLKENQFDSVFMLGGIHHVLDRERLFAEIFRILKPGGRLYWREPVSDFFLWRWLRAIIYRVSPMLDHNTERPLLYKEILPPLEKAGFQLKAWNTYGFLGFCFLMNSDVLVFNRLFRFLPGVRGFTKMMTCLDDWTVRLPGLRRAGLQVVGIAEKN